MSLHLASISLIGALAIAAGPNEAAPSEEQPAAAASATLPSGNLDGLLPTTTRTRLAVMALSANGVPDDYAVGLTETIATEAQKTGVFDTISPKQIASLLAYEKRKELLGACVQESCYVQVAQLVKAEHLLAGSIAKIGDKLVLNLVLIDALRGQALKRTNRETMNASELMSEASQAAIVALQPVLSERRGFLKVAVNVPSAAITVDDERRSEGVGQVIPLSAGPHVLKIAREGFYTTAADVFVRPGRVTDENVKLIPAKDTVSSYESKANLMRYGAYATGALAIGAGVVAGVFYAKASDNKTAVDRYTSALDADRASGRVGTYEDAQAAQDSFSTNQSLYLITLGGAVVAGAASLYLFLAGDDPDRYEEFHSLER